MKKIPKKYTPYVFTFYAALTMSLVMAMVLVAVNTGIDQGYWLRTFKAWTKAFPAGFFSFLFLRPLVVRLVEWSTE